MSGVDIYHQILDAVEFYDYAPGADPEQTLVATADLSFVVLEDGEPASQTGRA